jgi:hypothetical protein
MDQVLTADWHLTDDPYDEYRWGLIPWLCGQLRSKLAGGVRDLYILGDICEKKDRHSERLVNRVVDSIVSLYRQGNVHRIVILGANHDGLDLPFFRFLGYLPYVRYITAPEILQTCGKRIGLLPYTKRPEHDWKGFDFESCHYIYTHVTVSGAKAETGITLEGQASFDVLKSLRLARITGESRVFSGDVHVPQRVGAVEYVGAPYPVRFGDRFKSRVVHLSRVGRQEDWHYPTIRKIKISATGLDSLKRAWLRRGDQLRVELLLGRAERHEYHKRAEQIQKYCEEKGVVLRGIELMGAPTLRLRDRKDGQVPSQSRPALSNRAAVALYAHRNNAEPETIEEGTRLLRIAQKDS